MICAINKMNNKIISNGELAIGQKVTVLSWKQILIDEVTGNFLTGETQIQTRTVNDNSYKGNVLEIVAIDLPYIAVINHSDNWQKKAFKLDTRRVDLMELSEAYVKAILG